MNTEDEEFQRIEQEIKRKTGRPPIDPAKKRHMVSISLTIAQREKMRRLGGSWWVQTQIDNAKDEPARQSS